MAKALKTAAIIVAVAAAVVAIPGVGAAVGAAVGASAATVTAVAAAAATITSIAATAAAKPPDALAGGSQTDFSADPRAGVPHLMGTTATSGNIVFRRAADGWSENTPNDLQDFVTILSGAGPIKGIRSFTSDDAAITFDAAGNAIGDFHDKMFQKTQLGVCPEPAALTVQAGASYRPTGWTTAHKLSGLAATIWRLRYDAKQRFFQNGVPKPVWLCDGVATYDPRLDSTYPGGSGAQRWNDETTWTPGGANPYLHALSWCIGYHQNGKRVAGLGMPIDAITVSEFVEGANIADANGWTLGGVIWTRPDTKWNTLKLMLQAGAGEPLRIGARVGCLINTPRVSLATITPADIIGSAKLAAMQPIRNRLNTVIPRYRSTAHKYEIVPADPIQVEPYVIEDGDERTKEIEYTLVQDVDQAAQLARYDIENTRELGPGSFPLLPKWLNYKAGDCVTIDTPEVAGLKVLLMKRSIAPATAIVTFEVRSETDGKHAFALGQTGIAPPTASISAYDPSVAAPSADDWMLTGTTLTANGASIPAIVAVGAVNNYNADAVLFDFRPYVAGQDAEANWAGGSVEAPTIVRKEFTGVTPKTQYEVGVRYRVRGVIGDRRILGPVTAGEFTTAAGAKGISARDPLYPVTSTATSVSIAAFSGTVSGGIGVMQFPPATLPATASSVYDVFWSLSGQAYQLVAAPGLDAFANPDLVFLEQVGTADGTTGDYPATETPPGGYRGSGGGYNGAQLQ